MSRDIFFFFEEMSRKALKGWTLV